MSDGTLKSFVPNTVCDSYTALKLHGMLWVSSRGTPTKKEVLEDGGDVVL